jgi:hypothetical protein
MYITAATTTIPYMDIEEEEAEEDESERNFLCSFAAK